MHTLKRFQKLWGMLSDQQNFGVNSYTRKKWASTCLRSLLSLSHRCLLLLHLILVLGGPHLGTARYLTRYMNSCLGTNEALHCPPCFLVPGSWPHIFYLFLAQDTGEKLHCPPAYGDCGQRQKSKISQAQLNVWKKVAPPSFSFNWSLDCVNILCPVSIVFIFAVSISLNP